MTLTPGFADPVFDAQRAFRAVMAAFARPGTAHVLAADLKPPPPLTSELAAVALTLIDQETPVWLDSKLATAADVAAFVRFHAGAPIVTDPAGAAFALITDPLAMPPLAAFAQGSDAYPDRSATLIMQVESFTGAALALSGPGIDGSTTFAASPLPADFAAQLAANRALFPRGVDVILCASGEVAALPRSVRLKEVA